MSQFPGIASPLRESFVSTNGVSLHVVEAGPADGSPVILLHGFPEFWYGWRRQIDPLAAAGFRVVVPDQRGYNTSDKPRGVAAYNIDLLAADVIGLIDHLGVERAAVVGHDWGAAVIWWAAMRHPARIERAAVLNVPHPVVMRRELKRNFSQLRKSWYMFFFQLPRLPEWLLERKRCQPLVDSLAKTSRPGTFTPDELEHYRAAFLQPGAVTAMLNWYRAMIRTQTAKIESVRIRVPMLMLWGARDRFIGRELAQPSLELCDEGRLEFFEQATHWVQHEEAAGINAQLLQFLQAPSPLPAHAS
ncbi:MAG: alpha/beta hydrolase [Pirellulales bacterium]|nr:alpha/beta hydrolase [Pirellulales bacterium]